MDVIARLDEASRPEPDAPFGTAEVIDPAAGFFPDGRRKITVRWQGVEFDAGYLAAYTPAAGDFVHFARWGSSVFVHGQAAT